MGSTEENAAKIEALEAQIGSMARSMKDIADHLKSGNGSVAGLAGMNANTQFTAYLMSSLDGARKDLSRIIDKQDPIAMLSGFIELVNDMKGGGDEGEIQPTDALKLIQSALGASKGNQRAPSGSADGGADRTAEPDNPPRSEADPVEG